MSVASEEAEKYATAWADPRYRRNAWGLALWQSRREIFPQTVRSALDVGCGHGRLMAAWLDEGIDARGVDIADGLDDDLRASCEARLTVCPLWDYRSDMQFELGVAADVLEHLPEVFVGPSLEALARCCRVVVAQTAEYPSEDWEGRTLHLTLRPATWWAAKMISIGGTVEPLPIQPRAIGDVHLLRWMLA